MRPYLFIGVYSVIMIMTAALLNTSCSANDPGSSTYQRINRRIQSRDKKERVIEIVNMLRNSPYKTDPLGESIHDSVDSDPLYDLDSMDCVTFVEQVFAIALTDSFPDFMNVLTRIRYNRARISYAARNHFLSGDWIPNNAWLFNNVTPLLATEEKTVTETRILYKKRFFAKHGIASKDDSCTLTYIPKSYLKYFQENLVSGDIILCIGSRKDIFVMHVGIIENPERKKPRLWHASSRSKSVVSEDFSDYFINKKKFKGFSVLRLREQ
jgi:hypothetical protein